MDHIVPLRKGGEDMLYNMYPSCRSCNQAKSTLDIEQFREFVQTAYQRAKQKPFFRIADAVGRSYESEKPVRFYFEQFIADGWDRLSSDQKQCIKEIPNFEHKKFEMITGINTEREGNE